MSNKVFAEGVVETFHDCVSEDERKQRLSVLLINVFIWIGLTATVIGTFGVVLIFAIIGKMVEWLISEYNVRRLQAYGCTVSTDQFPTVLKAADEICERFGIENHYRIIVLPSGELNAFAIKFAKKKVVVVLSEMLEAVIESPEQLRALLAHELCHTVLDHGWRYMFEIYKPMRYRSSRELTCDNAGLVACGDLEAAKTLLKKLCVGRRLFKLVDEDALIAESKDIYKGITGYFVRQYLSHPPAGARITNLEDFYEEVSDE